MSYLFHFSLCRYSLHLDTEQCARSPERRATARTLRVWNRLLRRPIFILSGNGAVFVRDRERDPPRLGWQLLSKCRRHFSKFKCWQFVSPHWRHSCRSSRPELRQQNRRGAHGRYEGDHSDLHSERRCRAGLRRVDPQSANVHACKVRRSDSHSSNLGNTTAKDRCQELRSFNERPPCTLNHRLWRRCRPGGSDRRDRRFSWTILRLPCVLLFRRSQQDCPETLEKEMAWKPGDDCIASTTRHRP